MTDKEINDAVAKELGYTSWSFAYSMDANDTREILNHVSQNRPVMSAAFLNALRDVLGPRMPKNSVGSPIISDFDLFMATPREICLAFLKVKGVKV